MHPIKLHGAEPAVSIQRRSAPRAAAGRAAGRPGHPLATLGGVLRRLAAMALALAIAPPCASAQAPARGPSPWRDVFEPERRLGLMYRQEGLARLVQSFLPDRPDLGDTQPYLLVEQALIRFERARRHLPDDAELAYFTAVALSNYRRPAQDGGTEHRDEEAMDAWRRVRRLDPSLHAGRVAFELAALHMRRHEFAEARAEYEAALQHAVPGAVEVMDRFYLSTGAERQLAYLFTPIQPVSVHGNLAEAAMLVGDLDDALEHYRAALEASDRPDTRVLALWGLALASDRSGAHEDALRFAQRAIQEDPLAGHPRYMDLSRRHGPFAILHFDGVFFEPRCELHAYEALGHEALARAPGAASDAEALRRALVAWRLFLAEGGNASRFAASARRHVARLEAEVEPPAAEPPRRPRRAPRERPAPARPARAPAS